MANALGAEIERQLVTDSAVVELQADLERCRLCGTQAIVELFTGYLLCHPSCDRLGREAAMLDGRWSGLHSAARLPAPSARLPTHIDADSGATSLPSESQSDEHYVRHDPAKRDAARR